ncbi:DNA cytosine methyltransferase [Polaromonas jejuensis]|uniref:DNA cytosine methyltransferase n=1 Tax=Polaromonas jejuensis TaxID=457502 RepID=A0ABW0Q9H4_9BURK|nr:DNA cytosine methyltransferase [Polaromonas jejuensis]
MAQHRRRLFIVGTRSKHPVELSLPARLHVGSGQIIDFDAGRWPVINKPGRAISTLSRISSGRAAHGPRFVTAYYGNEAGGRSLDRPVGTITTRDCWAVIASNRMRMPSVPECRRAMGFPDSYRLPERAKDEWPSGLERRPDYGPQETNPTDAAVNAASSPASFAPFSAKTMASGRVVPTSISCHVRL